MGHSSCCVVSCKNTGRNSKCKFYRFPTAAWKLEQRMQWISAVNRKNADGSPWYPKPVDLICSDHFIGGKKSDESASPSYVPTIFTPMFNSKKLNDSIAISRLKTFKERIKKKELSSAISTNQQKHPSSEPCHQTNVDPPEREPPKPPVVVHKVPKPLPPKCKACGKAFSGCIYECVQCEYRLCSACEQAGAHREHYILRVPSHSSKVELERVLSKIHEALKHMKFEKPLAMSNIKIQFKPREDSDEDSESTDDDLPLKPPEESVQVKIELELEEHDPFGDVPAAFVKTEQVDESFEDQRSATGQDAGTERVAIYGRVPGQSKPVVQVLSGSKPGLMSSTTYSESHGRVPSQNIPVFQVPPTKPTLKNSDTYLETYGRVPGQKKLVVHVPSVSKPARMDSTSYSQVNMAEIMIKSEPPDLEEPSVSHKAHPASKRSAPAATTRKGGRPKKTKPLSQS